MTSHVDLTRHQTADTDDASHDQYLEIQPLVREETFFLAVVERHVAQGRAGNADEKLLRCWAGTRMKEKTQQKGSDQSIGMSHVASVSANVYLFCRFDCKAPPHRRCARRQRSTMTRACESDRPIR